MTPRVTGSDQSISLEDGENRTKFRSLDFFKGGKTGLNEDHWKFREEK